MVNKSCCALHKISCPRNSQLEKPTVRVMLLLSWRGALVPVLDGSGVRIISGRALMRLLSTENSLRTPVLTRNTNWEQVMKANSHWSACEELTRRYVLCNVM